MYPLDFGSCIRKLAAWSCPYGMKCQDAVPCPYFTLIGRADDITKLNNKINVISRQIARLRHFYSIGELSKDELNELLAEFTLKKAHLHRLQEMSSRIESKKVRVDLIDHSNHHKPITLANIFAIEHRKLESKKGVI